VGFSLYEELDRTTDREWVSKMLDEIEKENPTILQFMAMYCEEDRTYSHFEVMFVLLTLYRMLQIQSECNALGE
jgi:phage/plasmid-associated DNA primase